MANNERNSEGPSLEGTDGSDKSLESNGEIPNGVNRDRSEQTTAVGASESLNRDATKKLESNKPDKSDDDWWTSPTALSVYFVACVAIFSTHTWILWGAVGFLLYKVAQVVFKWLRFFWSSEDFEELSRITKYLTGFLRRQGELTLEGGDGRRYVEGAVVFGAKAAKTHVYDYVEGKLDQLNQSMVHELRNRHGDNPK